MAWFVYNWGHWPGAWWRGLHVNLAWALVKTVEITLVFTISSTWACQWKRIGLHCKCSSCGKLADNDFKYVREWLTSCWLASHSQYSVLFIIVVDHETWLARPQASKSHGTLYAKEGENSHTAKRGKRERERDDKKSSTNFLGRGYNKRRADESLCKRKKMGHRGAREIYILSEFKARYFQERWDWSVFFCIV